MRTRTQTLARLQAEERARDANETPPSRPGRARRGQGGDGDASRRLFCAESSRRRAFCRSRLARGRDVRGFGARVRVALPRSETNPLRFGEAFGVFVRRRALGRWASPFRTRFSISSRRAAAAAEAGDRGRSRPRPKPGPRRARRRTRKHRRNRRRSGTRARASGWGARVRDAFVRESGLEPPRVVRARLCRAWTTWAPPSRRRTRCPCSRRPRWCARSCRAHPTCARSAATPRKPPAGRRRSGGGFSASRPLRSRARRARADEEAHALFDGLDGGAKLELLAFVLDDARVKRPATSWRVARPRPGTCAALFTRVPPRPPLRLKEGWDKPAQSGGPVNRTLRPARTPTPARPRSLPAPGGASYPEETEEEAEARRGAPTRRPTSTCAWCLTTAARTPRR